MDHWVKCTVTDGDSVHYINLDHVVTMYPISNDRETKIIFSGAGMDDDSLFTRTAVSLMDAVRGYVAGIGGTS